MENLTVTRIIIKQLAGGNLWEGQLNSPVKVILPVVLIATLLPR
jgi:hypothetical protein